MTTKQTCSNNSDNLAENNGPNLRTDDTAEIPGLAGAIHTKYGIFAVPQREHRFGDEKRIVSSVFGKPQPGHTTDQMLGDAAALLGEKGNPIQMDDWGNGWLRIVFGSRL